jgi:hypothetical protein
MKLKRSEAHQPEAAQRRVAAADPRSTEQTEPNAKAASLAHSLQNSPRMVAQSQAHERLFGPQGQTEEPVSQQQVVQQVVQLGRHGLGNSGRGQPPRGNPRQIPKRGKPDDERRRREAIGRYKPRPKRVRPAAAAAPFAPHGPQGGGQQAAQQDDEVESSSESSSEADEADLDDRPVVIVPDSDESSSSDDEFELARPPRRDDRRERDEPPDQVAIDIDLDVGPAAPPRRHRRRRGAAGVARRIGRKALGGRTWGDVSNAIGSASNMFAPDADDNPVPAASAFVAIGGLGVLVNGLKLLYDGGKQARAANTARAQREAFYALNTGYANVLSGLAGFVSGALSLSGAFTAGSLSGVASSTAWVDSEVTNIVSQIDILIRKSTDGRGWRSHWKGYLKASLALLASLVKCVGAVLSVYVAVAKAMGEDVDGASSAAIWMTLLGSAIGVLHGIIKLILVCRAEFGGAEEADDDNAGSDADDEHEDDERPPPRGEGRERDLELGEL